MENRCVVCGNVIPEGRQICLICGFDNNNNNKAYPYFKLGNDVCAICMEKHTEVDHSNGKHFCFKCNSKLNSASSKPVTITPSTFDKALRDGYYGAWKKQAYGVFGSLK